MATVGLARVARARGDAWEAARLLGDVEPKTVAVLSELAALERELGRTQTAARTLERALALGARDDHFHRMLAAALEEKHGGPEPSA